MPFLAHTLPCIYELTFGSDYANNNSKYIFLFFFPAWTPSPKWNQWLIKYGSDYTHGHNKINKKYNLSSPLCETNA